MTSVEELLRNAIARHREGDLDAAERCYRDILDVQYEDLVIDQESESRRLLDHCGLPWDKRCLDFHRHRRPIRTASSWQVRQPIHSRSVGRWRHYAQWIDALENGLSVPDAAEKPAGPSS